MQLAPTYTMTAEIEPKEMRGLSGEIHLINKKMARKERRSGERF